MPCPRVDEQLPPPDSRIGMEKREGFDHVRAHSQRLKDGLEAAGFGVSYSYGELFEVTKAQWNLDCSNAVQYARRLELNSRRRTCGE
jgi:hypothetical protein